jgi:2-(1,2-epoxy-1,2-dihydrophenyl)acetyl-CoA isomerase
MSMKIPAHDDPVEINRTGQVATIKLNRPDRLNALNAAVRHRLLEALRLIGADEGIRAVILTGAGRAFCVGQDLSAADELDDAHDTVSRTYNPLIRAITGMDKPVIAAVNGLAVGAGMGLALACDLVLMADNASFSCAFGKMALVPDSGTSWFLVRRVGYLLAFDLAMTGRKLTATDAARLGLANAVFSSAELLSKASERADELASGPRKSILLTKRLLVAAANQSLDATLENEALSQGIAAKNGEHTSRRIAFMRED